MEILSPILQCKLVRNPAEELLCLVLIFIMSVVVLKTIKAEPSDPSAYEFERGCTILHSQYKSSSTVSCLQKIRILTLTFGRRRQFRDGKMQCRTLGIKHYSIPINMPVRWSSTHTMIDKFYRMKDTIIAVLASQCFDDSILNFQSLIGLFLRNS